MLRVRNFLAKNRRKIELFVNRDIQILSPFFLKFSSQLSVRFSPFEELCEYIKKTSKDFENLILMNNEATEDSVY